MVKVTDKDFYIDGYLKNNLDAAKEVIKKDWDMLFVVDGYEGAGKSVMAMQAAYYCDPTLDLSRIVFTPEEFKTAIMKAEKYQAVVYDEAYGGLNSRQVLSQTNRILVKMLTEIRMKNLFVFIVLPSFFELDRYVSLHRSRALMHVYTADNFERGRFSFFNAERKKHLWFAGKKFFSYGQPKANFYGTFGNFYVVDSDEYKAKKLQATISIKEAKEEPPLTATHRRWLEQRNIAIKMLVEAKVNRELIKSKLGVGKDTIYETLVSDFDSTGGLIINKT